LPINAHITAIGTAVPDHDIHAAFIAWARARLPDPRSARVFDRMASRAAIHHRWSILPVGADGGSPVDVGGFYARDVLPGTAERMKLYAEAAPALALTAIAALGEKVALDGITHLVVASCTGFVAPGIDQIIAARLGLAPSVDQQPSEPDARVLVVCVELSTLHLQDSPALEPLLAMLQFGDGAAAALVCAEPTGFALGAPFATTLPDSAELIRWDITDQGFAMHLSGEVPGRIAAGLADPVFAAAATGGQDPQGIDGWAVHAGGRSLMRWRLRCRSGTMRWPRRAGCWRMSATCRRRR
jgi:predicted naringenin-chalcone synthase